MSCSHVTLNTFDQSNNFFLDAYNFCFTNHLSAFFPVLAWRLLNNVCTFGIGWISAAFLHKIQPLLEAQIYSTFCASPSHSERLITLRRDPSQEKKLELFHFHLINFVKFHDAIIQYAFAYKQKNPFHICSNLLKPLKVMNQGGKVTSIPSDSLQNCSFSCNVKNKIFGKWKIHWLVVF